MRRRYQPGHDESWSDECNGVLFQVPDIGVHRRDAQRQLA